MLSRVSSTHSTASSAPAETEAEIAQVSSPTPPPSRSPSGRLGELRSLSRHSQTAGARSSGEIEIELETSTHRSSDDGSSGHGSRIGPAPARSAPQVPGRLSRAVATAGKTLRMADLHTLLSPADDAQFLARMRREPEAGQTVQGNAAGDDGSVAAEGARLAQLSANVLGLKTALGDSRVPAELKQVVNKRLDQISHALAELNDVKPLANRAAKVIAINALLAPLPLIIPMMSKPPQRKTEAAIIALISKAMVEGVGLIRTPSTGNQLLKDRTMARYYANTVQALEFALPTFVGGLHFLDESTPFNIGLGVLSTVALFGGFMSKEIKEKFNQWRSGDRHPGLAAQGKALFGNMEGLGEELRASRVGMKAVLQRIMDGVTLDKQALLDTKETFVGGGQELSPYVGKQVSIAVSAYQQLADELVSLMGERVPAGMMRNKDRNPKLALALFATGVCAATTVLMLPDKIGVVDLGSDAAFTAALMFSLMANPDVGHKDALEEFKTFVGLSLVMLALLAANKGAKDFMEKGTSGLLIGSITMTALNLTLPGPVGHYAASGIEKLMNLNPSALLGTLRDVGHRVYQMFCGGDVQPAQRSNVVIEEIVPPDLEHGLGA